MNTRLSKSRFQKGLQCEKALWLSVHCPQLASPVTDARQWIFDQGTEVGLLAQKLFPCGIEVAEDHRHTAEALETTERLLRGGATVLYEPAFFFDGVLVRVDILVADPAGTWDIYEVKSTTRVKPEHITDAAIQAYVVEGSGLHVRDAHIVHIDNTYTFERGFHDPEALFTLERVTQQARALLPQIPDTIERQRRMLAGPEPVVRIGSRCNTPYACDFVDHCGSAVTGDPPVTALPRLSERALHALLDLAITDVREIPADFEMLTPRQQAIVDVIRSGQPHVDTSGLRRDIERLDWPVYHLDFETVNPAIPLWPGTRPYMTIPFQYSVHLHRRDGSHEHREYLHTSTDDPRRPLAERLIADLGDAGSVTHYTSFERRRLVELAEAFPDLEDAIARIVDRLVDLEPIIRVRTLHPLTVGYSSIKAVLPAWCPELSYEDLDIPDGSTASALYLRALRGEFSPAETRALHESLREYCGLDTYAMMRLLEAMLEQVER